MWCEGLDPGRWPETGFGEISGQRPRGLFGHFATQHGCLGSNDGTKELSLPLLKQRMYGMSTCV
jgi:hypothetical protein